MRQRPMLKFLVLALVAAVPLAPARADEESSSTSRPNIILMMADDQGWNGTSVAMHPSQSFSKSSQVKTPHLETLASQGMRFSQAYAPAPVCAPTRIALQTGRSAAALHWTKVGHSQAASAGYKLVGPKQKRALDTKETTIGETLKKAGYTTAHFGKWHIQGGGPEANGYDAGDGNLGNEHAAKFKDPNPVDIFGMTDRAAAFMKKAKDAKKPFFVQLSWHALHSPDNALEATKAEVAKRVGGSATDRRVQRTALAQDLDTGVGRILKALDELGLSKSTYVIYTSDNGAGGGGGGRGRGRRRGDSEGGLGGGKGSLGEGGIRVPFVIRGPGIAADSWNHTPITLLDLYPTFSHWAGARTLPKTIEGGNIAPLLAGVKDARVNRPRPGLAFHFPHYQNAATPQSTIRLGALKLVRTYEDGKEALYDLDADPKESTDLASKRPEDVKALSAMLDDWLKAVDAQMPTKNAEYDPDNPPEPNQRRGRRGKGEGKGGRKGRRQDR